MPTGLVRWQGDGDDHFITFSCYQRKPLLQPDAAKEFFLQKLEQLRRRHEFAVFGYVVMPEHVHLLLSEPPNISLANVLRALKGETSKQLRSDRKQFWQRRYHDVNVVSWDKRVEKIKYMHRNPVERAFVSTPAEYRWSSYRHYAFDEPALVQLDSKWIGGWQRR